MGRPIKRKYFGVQNVADGLTYSDAGGEGVSSITYTNRGTGYSQGLTATVAVSPIGGTRATISAVAVFTANGAISSATIGEAGTGYTSAPAITLVKPANVVATGVSINGSNVMVLSTTTGLYVGMTANTAFAGATKITAIDTANSAVTMSAANTGAVASTVFSFGDTGASGSLTAVLGAVDVTANTIQANAWTTNGTVGSQADIVSQRSARRYKVTNSVETDTCRLVANAAVASAGGPTGAGEMTITATDSVGGTYLVKKLDSRTATVYPVTGSQFAEDAQPIWTSTGVAVVNTTVKLATND